MFRFTMTKIIASIGSLFSGIGLLELGLERAGLGSVAWQCEIDPWCRRVLARHWPATERFDDVRTMQPRAVDVVCGGFPCQPFSVAGKQRGLDDERWLWPDFARVVEEAKPKVVVAENVPGLRARGLRPVLADLASLGFDVEWTHFRASELGAPHERNRIWIVATHPDRIDVRQQSGWLGRSIQRQAEAVHRCAAQAGADAGSFGRIESARRFATQRGWAGECGWTLNSLARVDDGRTEIVDAGRRRKALGNAVVMPCARAVGNAIVDAIGCES